MANLNPECAGTRKTIEGSAFWINNVEVHLDPGDDNYEDQQEGLNNNLQAASQAFNERPANCQMERHDDIFECTQCAFYIDIV